MFDRNSCPFVIYINHRAYCDYYDYGAVECGSPCPEEEDWEEFDSCPEDFEEEL
jgi:hypothetical protein